MKLSMTLLLKILTVVSISCVMSCPTFADDTATVRVSVSKMLDFVRKMHSPRTYDALVDWASGDAALQHPDLLDRLFKYDGSKLHPGYMDYEFDALVRVLRFPHIQAHASFGKWAGWVARAANEDKVDYVASSHGMTFPKPTFPDDLRALVNSCGNAFEE